VQLLLFLIKYTTMKFKHWFFIGVLFFLPVSVFTQQVMEFTQVKMTGDSKTVYFNVKGLGDDEAERAALMDNLLKDENVIKGRIYTSSSGKTKCQLFLPVNITAGYIRSIINSYGYDYDFTTVSVDGKLKDAEDPETFVSVSYLPEKDFPQYVKTGDKQKDADDYRLAKEKWISENERKYKKERSQGTTEYPIIIQKEDFNKYSEEKKQRLLAEPDKYVIK